MKHHVMNQLDDFEKGKETVKPAAFIKNRKDRRAGRN